MKIQKEKITSELIERAFLAMRKEANRTKIFEEWAKESIATSISAAVLRSTPILREVLEYNLDMRSLIGGIMIGMRAAELLAADEESKVVDAPTV